MVLPGRKHRCRRLFDEEPRPNASCTHVVVRQVRPGVREKCYFGHPSMTNHLDAVESEAMCKYLWDLAEGELTESETSLLARVRTVLASAAPETKP
jgi:hypothetical protein